MTLKKQYEGAVGSPSPVKEIQGTPAVGSTLTAVPADGWDFAAGVWQRQLQSPPYTVSPIAGATGLQYVLQDGDVGYRIRFAPTDPRFSQPGPILAGIAPSFSVLPTLNTLSVGTPITFTQGTASGSPTPTKTFQVFKNGVAVATTSGSYSDYTFGDEILLVASLSSPVANTTVNIGPVIVTFDEPTTSLAYMARMGAGIQVSDFLEQSNINNQGPSGANAVVEADYLRMAREGRCTNLRVPANAHARADKDGKISDAFLAQLKQHVDWGLKYFARVILDPLHHWNQAKNNHLYEYTLDTGGEFLVTAGGTVTTTPNPNTLRFWDWSQHGPRGKAMWLQIATFFKDYSTRLSFDLVNEPGIAMGALNDPATNSVGTPAAFTEAEINTWQLEVIDLIRNSGGNNAVRVKWMEPFNNKYHKLILPSVKTDIGVSPHFYFPFGYTHQSAVLTATGMAEYQADIATVKQYGIDNNVAVWSGESGASKYLAAADSGTLRANRPEFYAWIRAVNTAANFPFSYWGYGSLFPVYDQVSQTWLTDMKQAVSAFPTPLTTRSVQPIPTMVGGRLVRSASLSAAPSLPTGWSYDAVTGIMTAPENTTGADIVVGWMYPDVEVFPDEVWYVRGNVYKGVWVDFSCQTRFDNPLGWNLGAIAGVDQISVFPSGTASYGFVGSAMSQGAEQAIPNVLMGAQKQCLVVNMTQRAGSPAGQFSVGAARMVDNYADAVPVNKPTALSTTGVTPYRATLNWTAPVGDVARKYQVVCGDDSRVVTGTSCLLDFLDQNSSFTAMVRAINNSGYGPWSDPLTITTAAQTAVFPQLTIAGTAITKSGDSTTGNTFTVVNSVAVVADTDHAGSSDLKLPAGVDGEILFPYNYVSGTLFYVGMATTSGNPVKSAWAITATFSTSQNLSPNNVGSIRVPSGGTIKLKRVNGIWRVYYATAAAPNTWVLTNINLATNLNVDMWPVLAIASPSGTGARNIGPVKAYGFTA